MRTNKVENNKVLCPMCRELLVHRGESKLVTNGDEEIEVYKFVCRNGHIGYFPTGEFRVLPAAQEPLSHTFGIT